MHDDVGGCSVAAFRFSEEDFGDAELGFALAQQVVEPPFDVEVAGLAVDGDGFYVMLKCEVGALLAFCHAVDEVLEFGVEPFGFFGSAAVGEDGFGVDFHDGGHVVLKIVKHRLDKQRARQLVA